MTAAPSRILLLLALAAALPGRAGEAARWPAGFVDVATIDPSILVALHYATDENFVGERIDGYEANRALLTRPAAQALAAAQAELRSEGFGLMVLDAYRPQRAVMHFIRWAQAPGEAPTRDRYFPTLRKADLFRLGYLDPASAHSRGSAVDVTLVRREPDGSWQTLDLGSPPDGFGPPAAPEYPGLTPRQRELRRRLRDGLERHGFVASDREWWHFRLRDEPYPETYYDFPVQ